MNTDTKKSVEFQLLLTPRIEALALPFDQKSATRNPRQYKPIRRVVLCSAGIFPKREYAIQPNRYDPISRILTFRGRHRCYVL